MSDRWPTEQIGPRIIEIAPEGRGRYLKKHSEIYSDEQRARDKSADRRLYKDQERIARESLQYYQDARTGYRNVAAASSFPRIVDVSGYAGDIQGELTGLEARQHQLLIRPARQVSYEYSRQGDLRTEHLVKHPYGYPGKQNRNHHIKLARGDFQMEDKFDRIGDAHTALCLDSGTRVNTITIAPGRGRTGGRRYSDGYDDADDILTIAPGRRRSHEPSLGQSVRYRYSDGYDDADHIPIIAPGRGRSHGYRYGDDDIPIIAPRR